ncbi:uroporphyrinogen-III synthase [Lepagella muris]|uniref:Uroporphyrinogen-III synthase n=1 Tax=Lepagella muris TaxID=3032870 RepID=A0AC61RL82_9BACT|nr:uroporphyrinogen-III synthase [Lepagella muris]ROT06932.1 uroporphyrinogen-III synthase [Muribaculaceae bacterium Isolate-037 (Harlan)]TGY79621.1 uroporphyrinogen-III synthase [Lepagella muris]THG53091.1 uroporphyrinogen-III synthase [Bacteroidales bacterium]TKC62011.1 uroporphyrinogen-III synthase [Bacteroidales bacterium]
MKIKKILVSQPQPTSEKSPYFDIAKRHDVEIIFRPMIKVEGLSAKEFRQFKINLADYTAVIFTSRTAVDHYFRLCEECRFNVPDTMRYFCTSEQIALYLQKYIVYRKRKISFGITGKLDDSQFVQAILKNSKEKFLFPISDVQTDTLPVIADNKINYTPAVMYRTVSNDFTPDEPFDYDLLIFFSPAGIESLMKNFPDFGKDGKQPVCIGAFGPSTSKAVKDAGLRLDIEAPTKETPSMTAALDEFLTKNEG